VHPVLARQLRRLSLDPATPPALPAWQQLLERVARCYTDADEERYTLERLTEVSSQELAAVHQQLRDHHERRFHALLAGSSDTTIVLDPAGEITYVSSSATRVLHLPTDQLHGHPMTAFIARHVHPDDAGHLTTRLQQLFDTPGGEESVEFRLRRPDTSWRDIEGLGRNLLGDQAVRGVLLTLRDVSERKQLERALTRQAFTDQLTGLPNRALLHDRTHQAIRLADRHGLTTALLLLDLDRFKDVNDTLGHHHGDQLLQQVAHRLQATLRDSDTVARLGGDEFAVLLPQITSLQEATLVAAKLNTAIQAPFTINGLTLDIEASIGLAAYPDHATTPQALLQHADIAMYAAKATHDGPTTYDPTLDHHNPRRLGLLGQLRRALTAGELVVHYQPKADLRTRQILGVEALVRWQHPTHGLLSPDEFIPLAETTGLIRPLTTYVLDAALRQCRTWLDTGHQLTVAVNLSTRCLLDLTLPDQITRLLTDTAVPPHHLVLEITESAIMTDPTRALDILGRLHTQGVQLAIDDFGTGYSSMAYLKRLPVDELKVDRSFVTHLRDNHNDAMIVRTTVDLGHNLGLRVVAEGVEDQATLNQLATLGCDSAQGYHLAKPMPPAQLATWLATQPQPAPPTTDPADSWSELGSLPTHSQRTTTRHT
jgi:diguanylate cyclase (GGDEF)-like protein/PAS domain S-box-containing protein